MSNSQNFRSSFNGFNREDVVRYLEYLNSKHTTLVNQLSEEADNLRQKLSVAAEAISCDSSRAERIAALEDERDELKRQLEEALRAADTSDAARAALEEECASLRKQLDAALAAPAAVPAAASAPVYTMEKELEAYRRAERLERIAQAKADQIYRRTNGVLADATVKVDQAASDIGVIADRVMDQLQLLQQAVTGSKQALQDAAGVMYAIRPVGEEE